MSILSPRWVEACKERVPTILALCFKKKVRLTQSSPFKPLFPQKYSTFKYTGSAHEVKLDAECNLNPKKMQRASFSRKRATLQPTRNMLRHKTGASALVSFTGERNT
jgi:hypothetical protein